MTIMTDNKLCNNNLSLDIMKYFKCFVQDTIHSGGFRPGLGCLPQFRGHP